MVPIFYGLISSASVRISSSTEQSEEEGTTFLLFIPLHPSLMRTDNVSREMVVEDRQPLKTPVD